MFRALSRSLAHQGTVNVLLKTLYVPRCWSWINYECSPPILSPSRVILYWPLIALCQCDVCRTNGLRFLGMGNGSHEHKVLPLQTLTDLCSDPRPRRQGSLLAPVTSAGAVIPTVNFWFLEVYDVAIKCCLEGGGSYQIVLRYKRGKKKHTKWNICNFRHYLGLLGLWKPGNVAVSVPYWHSF